MESNPLSRPSSLAATRQRVTVEKYAYIPMRDGTHLAADIYLPARPARIPALVVRTPYDKNAPEFAAHLRNLASHGYAVVVNEMRGTNASEGVYDWYNYVHGPMDGYDAVEWVARQPWCDGNVGMFGGSAMGVACWQTAVQQPPHLKALFLTTGAPTDAYRDQWYIGGVFQLRNRVEWAHFVLPRLGLPAAPRADEPGAQIRMKAYRDRMAAIQRRLQDGKGLVNLDWFDEARQHPHDGAYWRARSTYPRFDALNVPVYLADNWDNHFATGTLRAFHAVNTPKKLLLFPRRLTPPPWGPATGEPPIDFEALTIQWFDHWLKGIDNGVMDEPPVMIYIQGEDAWRLEEEWPLARTQYRECYLHPGPSGSAQSLNDGILSPEPPSAGDESTCYLHDPATPIVTPHQQRDRRLAEERALTFTTPPLEHEVEVTGPITVCLYASSTASDTDWIVHLTDVAPDGTSRLLNHGALKASHRESSEQPTSLTPGSVYRFVIEVWPTSNLFKKGHRIRLSVAGSDFPAFEVQPQRAENRVYHTADRPSHLLLPVIPRQAP